jgi:hypothetical protein
MVLMLSVLTTLAGSPLMSVILPPASVAKIGRWVNYSASSYSGISFYYVFHSECRSLPKKTEGVAETLWEAVVTILKLKDAGEQALA